MKGMGKCCERVCNEKMVSISCMDDVKVILINIRVIFESNGEFFVCNFESWVCVVQYIYVHIKSFLNGEYESRMM